ncbi:MAG: glycosyltransferase family 25 protein [Paracoccaceae bacterium]
MTLKGYVINLASSPDRMTHARSELKSQNIEAVRVDGFDGREIDLASFAPYDDDKASRFMGRSMSGGEIGCYVGHERALTAFRDSGDHMAIVFEDDITFTTEAATALAPLLEWLGKRSDWHCVNIGTNRHKITTPVTTIAGLDVVRAHYFPMLAHALIWNQAGAQAFLDQAEPIFCPADNMMRHVLTKSDMGLATMRALVDAGSFDSDISARSGGNRSIQGRSKFYGFRKQRRLLTEKATAYSHQRARKRDR